MPKLEPIADIHDRIEKEEKFPEDIKEEFKQFVSNNYYDVEYGSGSVTLDNFLVRGFNNLSEAEVHFGGDDYIVYGKNALGKTTLIRAIQYNLMGLPDDKQKHGMTGIIQTGKKRLFTEGDWWIGTTRTRIQRELYREGRGGALHGEDKPVVIEDIDNSSVPEDRHDQPETVFNKVGISPLYNRDYDVYDFMSLFFLMSRDFLNFINWKGNSTEVIDILFGIYLTNVSNAVDNRMDKLGGIGGHMDDAKWKSEEYQNRLDEKREERNELKSRRAAIATRIADKRENLESLQSGDGSEERLNRLRSRKSSLKSKLADLKSQRTELISDLAEVRRVIERYEDNELTGDLKEVADELHDLLSVPDRCPVCMNDVDADQRRRLKNEHSCPLCSKDMPADRIEKEKEYQTPKSLSERREQQQQELEELLDDEADLDSRISQLDSRISATEKDIEEVEQRLEESDLDKEIERREELESEIRTLREEAVNLDMRLDTICVEITELEWEVKAQEHLMEMKNRRKDRKSYLERLSGIIDSERKNQRRKLQMQLQDQMEYLIQNCLTEGFFSEVTSVSFEGPENYHFTVHTPTRRYKSSQAEKESAEATLQSLIFHTAVLKHLSNSRDESLPFRLFAIDSPLSNDMDPGNESDVLSILSFLPDYLDDYQTIVTMAKPEEETMTMLESSGHTLLNFNEV
ncbi:AAA family ATPase [Haloarchaeobius sp. TZWWS8]|uniref:AAA family ATPase n=1 Tax=Haloarchaeobius sp. TZWWS8 TaxID=3446121 RepID=UPI003EBC5B9D